MRFLSILLILFLAGCAASNDPGHSRIRALYKKDAADDSSFVYALPYPKGTSHLMIQGYYSAYSHRNRIAVDFKMKPGTEIAAARGGVVMRIKEDGKRGGLKGEYRKEGNHVVIQHDDGTRAGYWHLQHNGALVNVGDTVTAGQVIALSGNTGYSAFPHLHFMVWTNQDGKWEQLPTRFETRKGPKYLRPLKRYRNK